MSLVTANIPGVVQQSQPNFLAIAKAAMKVFREASADFRIQHNPETVIVRSSGTVGQREIANYFNVVLAEYFRGLPNVSSENIGEAVKLLSRKLREGVDIKAAASSAGIDDDTLAKLATLFKSGNLKISYDGEAQVINTDVEFTLSKPALTDLVERVIELQEAANKRVSGKVD
ncbi:MAG: hypothetical protein A3I68_03765 [Candidatus Melainabacteria bacterium RIFCSPLOWO2_02_FULL_35_15]|nr:MAG: hypothetical protein A3F80_04080 [Candidatus Melainabacteria bacterium RIFCSPLOWO2_12_FULL_35_11]OGI14715.1 MAG: hypothetical protein A3I68_03765 [Candidatus Melainabacteria bacterium RIFCSPLOWO2_02_FULL_35_15]